ncbi:MAG: hypothetical protein KAX20_00615 [Candidatus Omnitrophica bacterium]|nr:hypothetical protein [Candidatus Omnitrophota bacterium]
MAIGRMKKITLIGPEDEGKKLTRFLQEKALLEITHFREEPTLKELSPKKVLSDKELEEKIRRLYYLKEILFSLEKGSPGKIRLSRAELLSIVEDFDLDSFYERVKALNERIKKRDRLKRRLKELQGELLPLGKVSLPLYQLLSTAFTKIGIYKVPSLQFNGLLREMGKVSPYFHLEAIKKDKKETLFLIIYHQEKEKEFLLLLSRYNAASQKFLPFHSTAAATLSFIKERLAITEEDISQLNNEMREFVLERNKILVLLDYYSSLKEQEDIQSSFGETKRAFLLTGWITERTLPNLKRHLKERFPVVALYFRDPKKGEEVPTVLENRALIEPFEAVTDLYGRPLYKGMDPSALLSIFFIFCFATCLSDSGYGLLLVIFSFILLKKLHLSEMGKRLCRLFLFCGLASIVVGAMTGSCFGDLLERIPFSPLKRLNERVTFLSPVKDPQDMMRFFYFALLFGYLQVSSGVMIKLAKSIKDFGVAGFKNLAPFLIQLGLPLWILALLSRREILPFSFLGDSFFYCLSGLLIFAFVSVILQQLREQKGVFMKLFWAGYSIYGMVVGNLLSDTLSYSRLFALGMTTALLAIVMNQLVSLALPIPYLGVILGILIFCFGHLFNLGINVLSAYVHTSRLQYLEFFTKFYEAGGRVFKPFRIERKYTIIKGSRSPQLL